MRWSWKLLIPLAALALAVPLALAFQPAPDPMGSACHERSEFLPQAIPARVVLDVTDETHARLEPGLAARVAEELRAALAAFPFGGAVSVATTDAEALPAGAHRLPVEVWLHAPLPHRPGERVGGRMCGNLLLLEERGIPDLDVWTKVHELGHFFGLPHHEHTYMMPFADQRSPEAARFSECQMGLLAEWVPGGTYVPHWDRDRAGICAPG